MQISFLGTGSGSSRLRSHTAIALECPDGTRVLLDAASGNSALRNAALLDIDLLGFDNVLLSHSHGDHMSGLAFLQFERALSGDDKPPLKVHASDDTLESVKLYCLQSQLNVTDVSGNFGRNSQGREVLHWRPTGPGRVIELGPRTTAFRFPVDHIAGAVGWRIESGGISIVFSGDTMYSTGLVKAAEGTDLLIHEAFSVGGAELAHSRGHSTASEAGQAAADARVSRLVLTHFPDAYHAVPQPLGEEAARSYTGGIDLAHDLRQMTIAGR